MVLFVPFWVIECCVALAMAYTGYRHTEIAERVWDTSEFHTHVFHPWAAGALSCPLSQAAGGAAGGGGGVAGGGVVGWVGNQLCGHLLPWVEDSGVWGTSLVWMQMWVCGCVGVLVAGWGVVRVLGVASDSTSSPPDSTSSPPDSTPPPGSTPGSSSGWGWMVRWMVAVGWAVGGWAIGEAFALDLAMYNNHEYLYILLSTTFALMHVGNLDPNLRVRVIAVLLATVYAWAGIIKLRTPDWSISMWIPLLLTMGPDVLVPYRSIIIPSDLIVVSIAWGGAILDAVWVPGMIGLSLWKPTFWNRHPILFAIASAPVLVFHASNKAVLPIGEFPLIMAILHFTLVATYDDGHQVVSESVDEDKAVGGKKKKTVGGKKKKRAVGGEERAMCQGQRYEWTAKTYVVIGLLALMIVGVNVVAWRGQREANFWERRSNRFGWMMMMRATSRPYLVLAIEDVGTGRQWAHDPFKSGLATDRQARKMSQDPAILDAYATFLHGRVFPSLPNGDRLVLVVRRSWIAVNGSPLQRYYKEGPVVPSLISGASPYDLVYPLLEFPLQQTSRGEYSISTILMYRFRARMAQKRAVPIFFAVRPGTSERIIVSAIVEEGVDVESKMGFQVISGSGTLNDVPISRGAGGHVEIFTVLYLVADETDPSPLLIEFATHHTWIRPRPISLEKATGFELTQTHPSLPHLPHLG